MLIIVFDIDGTLADTDHRIHHLTQSDKKDWDSFFAAMADDGLIDNMAELSRTLYESYYIVLLTGRPEKYRKVTQEWLHENDLFYHLLIMRPLDCREDDSTLKRRLLKEYFTTEERNDISTIFEDRKRVVDELRRAGYHVCHVAEGNF